MADIVVVGGGVIGLSIAYELAGQGVSVRVVERGELGREASWAGAGILPPGDPQFATTMQDRLGAYSCQLWPHWSEELHDETGIDNGFLRCGAVQVSAHGAVDQFQQDIHRLRTKGVRVETPPLPELLDIEPKLNSRLAAGYLVPDLCQVRNPRHLKAMVAACDRRSVELSPFTPVVDVIRHGDRVQAIQTPDDRICADQFCIAGGPWSGQILNQAKYHIELKPIRGQMVLLQTQPSLISRVIENGKRYIVPRPDGRVLVGSSEECVGFEKRTTTGVISELMQFAIELVPSLAQANYVQAWSGLRPVTPNHSPILEQIPGLENLFLATGHNRAGLQLSPVTAVLLRQLMLRQDLLMPLAEFSSRDYQSGNRTATEHTAR
ncbi:MAG: glycine oxidase ThiO [Planctomycetaceae bacterium]